MQGIGTNYKRTSSSYFGHFVALHNLWRLYLSVFVTLDTHPVLWASKASPITLSRHSMWHVFLSEVSIAVHLICLELSLGFRNQETRIEIVNSGAKGTMRDTHFRPTSKAGLYLFDVRQFNIYKWFHVLLIKPLTDMGEKSNKNHTGKGRMRQACIKPENIDN